MAQVLRFPSIQTAAQDPQVRAIVEAYEARQELRATIRAQRVMIWALVAVVVVMAVLR